MQTEIEVKFVNVDHDAVRQALAAAGAKNTEPMRLMKRVTIDTPAMKAKQAFLRVRDEGDRTTMTYKQFSELSIDGAKEIEIIISDFNAAIALLGAAGLHQGSYQESRRETWKLGDVEIVLDEWPWLKPYIEIEGPSIEAVQSAAATLGFKWDDGVFGDVMAAYRAQYPHLKLHETIGNIPEVKFSDPIPAFLTTTQ